jgi:hypothetical protein
MQESLFRVKLNNVSVNPVLGTRMTTGRTFLIDDGFIYAFQLTIAF